jgi:phosphoglycolate phosphatase-like HAD superfamily hydrolase
MTELLSSWHDTPTRQAILEFVAAVTGAGSPHYVPPANRIATFDNDGTLWCEKPTYLQLLFTIERLKEMARADAALLDKPAFQAAAEEDLAYFAGLYPDHVSTLMQIVFDTHAGMTQAEFEAQALTFLSEHKHPRYGVPFKQLTYKPMVELLRYLEANDFKVYIASAGGMSFVRTVAEEIYGIPRERVIGSNITFEPQMTDAGPVLYRKPGLVEPLDDGPGKPVNIELHIGRKPILAGGNADGDIEMLWYSETGGSKSLQLVLHHDDAEREYGYEGVSAKRIFPLARERGWTVISMKNDWREVF